MLDSSSSSYNKLTFNSISGTLVKSVADSRFAKFHVHSEMAEKVFANPPIIYKQEIETLQIMLTPNDCVIMEYRFKED